MYINPVILCALFVQSVIAGISRMTGAVVGFLITTGILVWGLSAYAEGNAIALFGIPLTQEAFLIACAVWYGFDTYELVSAQRESAAEVDPLDRPAPKEDADGVGRVG